MYEPKKPRKGLAALCAALAAATAGLPTTAAAQDTGESAFRRDRNVSVQTRPRPEYEARGIRRGAFVWRPALRTSLAYSDNVFAAETDEASDGILVVQPELRVLSDWRAHEVQAFARLLHEEFFDNSGESTTGYATGASGRLDASRAVQLRASATHQRGFERRSAVGASRVSQKPIAFDRSELSLGATREVGRVRLAVDGTLSDSDFDDARGEEGARIDQDFRDQRALGIVGRADYAVTPDTALFAQLGYADVSHDQTPLGGVSRDRDTWTARIGADFELSALLRGQLAAGYFNTAYTAGAFADVDGFGFDGALEWFATPLITVSATAERGTRSSELLLSPSTTLTRVGARVDYEYRRNIILSAGLDAADDAYDFIDRDDTRRDAFVSGLLLMNPKLGLEAQLSRRSLDSDGALAQGDFSETRILLGLRWQI